MSKLSLRKEIRLSKEQVDFLQNAAFLFSKKRGTTMSEADIIREALDAYRHALEGVSETDWIMEYPDFARKIEKLMKKPGKLSTYDEVFK
ncbi:MAG: hypothetical protein AABY87_09000 [bacterium]